jgi:hypothetical protein
MNECGRATQLCKAKEYVCEWGFLIFQIIEDLRPAFDELKKSFFVCF